MALDMCYLNFIFICKPIYLHLYGSCLDSYLQISPIAIRYISQVKFVVGCTDRHSNRFPFVRIDTNYSRMQLAYHTTPARNLAQHMSP